MNLGSIRKKVIQSKQRMENNATLVFSVILIFVAFSSFGLGRLSALESMRNQPQIYVPAQNYESNARKDMFLSPGGRVVASLKGKKYHAPWCSGANKISEKNKIWFKNESEARAAGYQPASNCKGLK